MAACLITVSGTSGYVGISYTIGGNNYFISPAYVGDPQYIDDSATNVFFQTLEGDATASSSCVTITEEIQTCYLFTYSTSLNCFPNIYGGYNDQYEFEAIILSGVTYNLSSPANISPISESGVTFSTKVNTTSAGSMIRVSDFYLEMDVNNVYKPYYIITIANSVDVPILKINNTLDNSKTYLNGELSVSCSASPLVTTTTTFAP